MNKQLLSRQLPYTFNSNQPNAGGSRLQRWLGFYILNDMIFKRDQLGISGEDILKSSKIVNVMYINGHASFIDATKDNIDNFDKYNLWPIVTITNDHVGFVFYNNKRYSFIGKDDKTTDELTAAMNTGHPTSEQDILKLAALQAYEDFSDYRDEMKLKIA